MVARLSRVGALALVVPGVVVPGVVVLLSGALALLVARSRSSGCGALCVLSLLVLVVRPGALLGVSCSVFMP